MYSASRSTQRVGVVLEPSEVLMKISMHETRTEQEHGHLAVFRDTWGSQELSSFDDVRQWLKLGYSVMETGLPGALPMLDRPSQSQSGLEDGDFHPESQGVPSLRLPGKAAG